jgi:uncharacterized membrane protein
LGIISSEYVFTITLYSFANTFAGCKKEIRKGKKEKIVIETLEEKKKSEFTPSLIFRIVFISLLAIIIAQPLNVLLLSSFSERSLANHKPNTG